MISGDELEGNTWVPPGGAHFWACYKDHPEVMLWLILMAMMMMMVVRVVIMPIMTMTVTVTMTMTVTSRFCNEMDHRIRHLEDIQTIPWFKVNIVIIIVIILNIIIIIVILIIIVVTVSTFIIIIQGVSGVILYICVQHLCILYICTLNNVNINTGGRLVAYQRETCSHSCWGETDFFLNLDLKFEF